MRVTATDRAVAVIERAKGVRAGTLTVTIGTGCCESTAPFLYEDFWPGPDQQVVGEVADVAIYAPDYLRALYPADDGVRLDVTEELAESLSIETEFGCRLILRGAGLSAQGAAQALIDSTGEPEVCAVPTTRSTRAVVGELPEELRRARMR